MTTHYGDKEIATLPHPYLLNIIAKMKREEADEPELLAALEAQAASNEARFTEQRATLEAEGITVTPATGYMRGKPTEGYEARDPSGTAMMQTFSKDEGAAWGKAWIALKGEE